MALRDIHNCVGVEMGGGEGAVMHDKCCYSRSIKILLTYLPTHMEKRRDQDAKPGRY